jgi:hypothetical protein
MMCLVKAIAISVGLVTQLRPITLALAIKDGRARIAQSLIVQTIATTKEIVILKD